MYERGLLDRELSFEDLRRESHINEKARSADGDAEFSRRIRAGLPDPRAPAVGADAVRVHEG
jgi:hypothetical protein